MPRRIRLTLVQTCILLLLALRLALAQSTPKRGGTILWFDYADPARLDLHTGSPFNVSQAIVGIYSGLVQWGPEHGMKVSPDLVERWEASADGSVYTFRIGIRGMRKTHESAAGFAAWVRGEVTLIGVQDTALIFSDASAPFTLMWTTKSPRNYDTLPMPGLDELYEKGLRELDAAKRQAVYHEDQRRILRGTTPIVTFGWPRGPWFMAQKIKG